MVRRTLTPVRRSRDSAREFGEVARFGAGLVLGTVLGAGLGVATGDVNLGVAVGAGVGAGVGAVLAGARVPLRREK